MTTLVLAVDRDDDFGDKLGLIGPLVGREACLDAAVRLALHDPEDADANGLFAAVKEHDEIRAQGGDAEVALLLGDADVGSMSDVEIVRNLERVLERIRPTRVVCVIDGAEDEGVLPLIAKRVPIAAVRRVVVAQHAGLEAFLVALSKGVESPKVQRRYVIPFVAGLIVLGVLSAIGLLGLAVAVVSLASAGYLLWRMSQARRP